MQTIDEFSVSYDEITNVLNEVKAKLEGVKFKHHNSPIHHKLDSLIEDVQKLQRITPKEYVDDIVALADRFLSNGSGKVGIEKKRYYPDTRADEQLSAFNPKDLWKKLLNQYGNSAEQIALHKTAQKTVRLMGLKIDDTVKRVKGMVSIDIYAYWDSDYCGGFQYGMGTCKDFNALAECLSIVAEKEDCEALTWIARDIHLFFQRGWSKKVVSRDCVRNEYFELTVFKANKINLKLCEEAFEALANFISKHRGFMND